jgi:hypothetical protein
MRHRGLGLRVGSGCAGRCLVSLHLRQTAIGREGRLAGAVVVTVVGASIRTWGSVAFTLVTPRSLGFVVCCLTLCSIRALNTWPAELGQLLSGNETLRRGNTQ